VEKCNAIVSDGEIKRRMDAATIYVLVGDRILNYEKEKEK
jgi:hypothetical protein